MTPKQEREWAQDILKRIDTEVPEVAADLFYICRAHVEGFAKNELYYKKPFSRQIASLFEDILWMVECDKGAITRDEFIKRLEDKAEAKSKEALAARKKRLDSTRRRKRKKRTTSGR